MSREIDDERFLNVFRELDDPSTQTLTTDDLAEEFDIHQRTVQNYMNRLEDEGRLVLARDGKPKHWRLDEDEPQEPLLDERIIAARRRGKKLNRLSTSGFMVSVGLLAASAIVMSNQAYAQFLGIDIPLVTSEASGLAALTGVAATGVFLLTFVGFIAGYALPRYVEWKIDTKKDQ